MPDYSSGWGFEQATAQWEHLRSIGAVRDPRRPNAEKSGWRGNEYILADDDGREIAAWLAEDGGSKKTLIRPPIPEEQTVGAFDGQPLDTKKKKKPDDKK